MKFYTLDEAIRREVRRPDLLENAIQTMDVMDAVLLALQEGRIKAKTRTFVDAIEGRVQRDVPPGFWFSHRIDIPDYLMTGMGRVSDKFWMNVPSYSDFLLRGPDVDRWLFRRRLQRAFAWLRRPSLPPLNRKPVQVVVERAIYKAVRENAEFAQVAPNEFWGGKIKAREDLPQ